MSEPIFTDRLFQFLSDLKKNNDRDWFAENKTRYESDVRSPAVELVRQLEKPLARATPMLQVVPKGHGGSVMRIYRDTRFSKDKTPYKTNVGISIRHQANADIHSPGVYLHLEPKNCFIGAGCWRPERQTLASIRQAISDQGKNWLGARNRKSFRARYELAGESLKTAPRDYPKDHPMIEDLRRIDFIAIAPIDDQQMLGGDVIKQVIDDIKLAKPLMSFLCDAVGVPY